MTVFPGLPPIQSHPVMNVLRQQDRTRVNWDTWRTYLASPGTSAPSKSHTAAGGTDPFRGQHFDAYA